MLPLLFLQNPQSKVSWDHDEHDFGKIPHQQPAFATFVMTNTSDEPIILDNVRTSCGCTSPIWNRDSIMPQDTAHIVVEYDAHDYGEFAKVIKVFINKQRKAEKLYILGEVE